MVDGLKSRATRNVRFGSSIKSHAQAMPSEYNIHADGQEPCSFRMLQENLTVDIKLYFHDPKEPLFFTLDRLKLVFGLFTSNSVNRGMVTASLVADYCFTSLNLSLLCPSVPVKSSNGMALQKKKQL